MDIPSNATEVCPFTDHPVDMDSRFGVADVVFLVVRDDRSIVRIDVIQCNILRRWDRGGGGLFCGLFCGHCGGGAQ